MRISSVAGVPEFQPEDRGVYARMQRLGEEACKPMGGAPEGQSGEDSVLCISIDGMDQVISKSHSSNPFVQT